MPGEIEKKYTQRKKPLSVLKKLIELFTDEGDVVIDPVAGSGSTLLAAKILNRHSYGFEIKKDFLHRSYKNINETKTIIKNNQTMTQTDIFDFID